MKLKYQKGISCWPTVFIYTLWFKKDPDVIDCGNLNSHLMASCVGNIRTENYYNLIILLQVTINKMNLGQ